MMFGLKEDHIALLNGIFKKYDAIEEVILYGSRAKGSHTDRSDIDLALKGNMDRYIISSIAMDAQDSDLPYKIDLQDYNKIANFALKDHIDRVGKIFYKKVR